VANLKGLLKNVNTFMFDVDGVLSDGSVWTHPDGEQIRRMNIKDGYAIQHAVKKGYNIIIISGGTSEGVRKRLSTLGVTEINLGARSKIAVYMQMMNKFQLTAENVLYMGDDIPDFPVMQKVGFAACPHDAAHEIKSICHYISPKLGGQGCARDVIEQVLTLHQKWFDEDSFEW